MKRNRRQGDRQGDSHVCTRTLHESRWLTSLKHQEQNGNTGHLTVIPDRDQVRFPHGASEGKHTNMVLGDLGAYWVLELCDICSLGTESAPFNPSHARVSPLQ